jgi:acetolactate decarboxylase
MQQASTRIANAMNRHISFLFISVMLTCAGCAHLPPANTVTQISTIDALLAGAYTGTLPCRQLMQYGDLGIGTFDRLDGEMMLVNGRMHQIKADGKVYTPDPHATTPFAAVCRFTPDTAIPVNQTMTGQELKQFMDARLPDQNRFYAFKITGRFNTACTRSVPAQQPPYQPLVKVTASQPEFTRTNITGIIVGFRCPPFVKGVNVPGYHLHFLADSEDFGGHLLDFSIAGGIIQADACNRFLMLLPENSDVTENMDLSSDRSRELQQVEQ